MTDGSSQGLFVIIAVVIFGIFVSISYIIFKDTLQPALANIFKDSLTQAEENLTGIVKENLSNVQSSREDDEYLYAKIRDADEVKGETEIWVQAKKLDDGTLELYKSSISDGDYTYGSSKMTGSLAIPDTINGMKIVEIGSSAFRNSEFKGELKLPDSLEVIGFRAFQFTPFNGELKLPDSLEYISTGAFEKSTFTGELKLPNSLKVIAYDAFKDSKFEGTLDVSHVTFIQGGAFAESKIDEVILGDVKISGESGQYNTSGLNSKAIKLANGSWYDGSNA